MNRTGHIVHNGYTVTCGTCGSTFTLELAKTRTEARHTLLKLGWAEKTINSKPLMYCPNCGCPERGRGDA